MNRRNFFASSAALGLATLTPSLAVADRTTGANIITDISSNHGHAVELNLPEVVSLLQKANQEGPQTLNIQGASSHPHDLIVAESDLIALLTTGELLLDSSQVGGHTHAIMITLELLA